MQQYLAFFHLFSDKKEASERKPLIQQLLISEHFPKLVRRIKRHEGLHRILDL